MRWRTIARSSKGASAVEFALLAPVFIAFLLGVIEMSRLAWTQQVVQQAAFAAARCFGLGAGACATDTATRNYAVARAAAGGLTIPVSGVAVQANGSCHGLSGQAMVSISIQSRSAVAGLLPMFDRQVTSTACFPMQPPES